MTMIPYCGHDQPELDPMPVSDDAIRLHRAEVEIEQLRHQVKSLTAALAIAARVLAPYAARQSARAR